MIEVVVTLAVVVVGLWAMLDLHIRLQVLETESSQRTRAQLLLEDMAARLRANPAAASEYLTDPVAGLGAEPCADPGLTAPLAARDMAQWCRRLKGESALDADGEPVAGLFAGRGCIEVLEGGAAPQYALTIVWQGLTALSPPPVAVRCGKGGYDLPTRSACVGFAGACRRFITTVVSFPSLESL